MVAQPETPKIAGPDSSDPDVGYTLSVPTPELRGAFRGDLLSYGIYAVAALSLFFVIIIASGRSGVPEESFSQIALLMCPVTMIVVLAGFWTMRLSLRNERTVQDRFFSTVKNRLNLSPIEYTDILQKPDTLILTDGETLTLWEAEYTPENITIRRVRPSVA